MPSSRVFEALSSCFSSHVHLLPSALGSPSSPRHRVSTLHALQAPNVLKLASALRLVPSPTRKALGQCVLAAAHDIPASPRQGWASPTYSVTQDHWLSIALVRCPSLLSRQPATSVLKRRDLSSQVGVGQPVRGYRGSMRRCVALYTPSLPLLLTVTPSCYPLSPPDTLCPLLIPFVPS
ncbi:uncharacterized protein SCHCODRAFT_02644499 [Schizophyllum commune H4-8]|uniref:uncharacterized protein n=1 Tax=Schizophyllum commune (strain H4-8 / FGSC 9210) TaxID=578458 RepID=UPI0021608ADF|nr:uncharacterized protein SCHCODRAFT_02644499 [Schizophyllum commune H4-8]KAI5885347.1 hypothetical protein SCHCODRAFT_02644499 [Schizophyllum commune H4-8]